MRPPAAGHLARLTIPLLMQLASLTQAPCAVCQEPSTSPQPHLTAAARSRLTEAAGDSTLEPWQRAFMMEVAQGRSARAVAAPSPALSGVALRTTGTTSDDGSWIEFPPPSGRYGHSAIYDPVRDRMVVFGGNDDSIGLLNDVWVLTLAGSPAWSALTPAGSPPRARYLHTAIYDPVRDRMVVFGGDDFIAGNLNDVWALTLAGSPAWSAITPSGSPPSARQGHTAIYDPVRDRMVVFGGYDGTLRDDVWALSLAGNPAWIALAPAGSSPSARFLHSAIYDPARDRMVVFGGHDGTNVFLGDVWALALAGSPTWSALAPAGSPPTARYLHTAIYDPVRDRMVVFGGADVSLCNDVWALALAGSPAWSALPPAGSPPSERYNHTAIYDPVRDRMVVFGGWDGINRNDVWALSLAGTPDWSALTPAGSRPPGREWHAAIYDPVRERMLVFGGWDGSVRNDVWALSLAGSPAWSALAPAGSPPSARTQHTAIYDPVRDRMVVFGGVDTISYHNDVWELSLAGSPAWSALTPSGSPPTARQGHTAIYDPVRDRMVVFAGADGSLRNDVWALSLAESPQWSLLTPRGSPPPARYAHTAIYDPVRDRMVVFGGKDDSYLNDVWVLSLARSPAWIALAPARSLPTARYGHTATYDPLRDRMVVFGGSDGSYLNDAWALSLGGSPAWSALAPAGSPPPVRFSHTAIYDQVRDRLIVFGGAGEIDFRNDAWALRWGTPVAVAQSAPGRLQLDAPRPNPSRGETTVDFELVQPARVVLDLFDVRGRRVKRIADEWFTVGRHASMWRGDDESGHALGSGVYFIRMQTGGFQATRRMVRVR